MRSFLIFLVCVAALAGGAGLAVVAGNHLPEIAQFWNAGNAVYGTVAAPAAPDANDAESKPWKASADLPAHPNWTWHMPDGKTYENVVVTGVSQNQVTISHSLGIAHLSLDELPADVQAELHYTPSPTAGGSNELTPVAAMLNDKLVNSTGQPVPTPGAAIKHYAIYYSASWCAPCHTFTPTLVDWYRNFKPNHPDFELIFVSEDQNEAAMFSYMTEMQMPWPAVKYSELPRTNGTFRGPDIQQFANNGIPDLVLVDSSGKVLADSFNGSTYVGPQSVITYMNSNL
ncbi:MAG TPA: thioredoxin-like domain-containing protein [Candidatus Methylacidiphilales bacterium]|nr:thioredoxin-like domain-containing protein [Candidatus Methylacidiphilales bacterium]